MDWKKLGKKLLFPPVWLTALLAVISGTALAAVFITSREQSYIAYIVYALAFYTLCAVTCYFAAVFPKQYKKIKGKLYANPLGNRCMTDKSFRAKLSLRLALTVSLLYVGINLWSWHMLRSWWFMVLAVYYVIMAVMRFLLVRYVSTNALGSSVVREWKRARSCACILLLINLSLSGAVLMILYQHRGYHYPGVMIYVMALYTFYSTTHAIIDIVRYRTLGSPVMSTAKIVSLCGALVSMLNLETAMFAQFGGEMAQRDQNLMIILTGAGISVTVVTLSVRLIVRATKEIRRGKNGK